MIITRTPVRVSLFGGGTDYPESIKQWGGLVVGSCINKYSYITCRRLPKFFNYHSRIVYSKIETVPSNNDIEHRVVKAAIKACGLSNVPLEISHMADLPSKSGTGSSSTFTVGLINALSLLNNEHLNPFELYNYAKTIEQTILQENVGCQDQAWAAFGGMNSIEFTPCGRIKVIPILKSEADIIKLSNSLIMYFTGIHRTSSDVAGTYVPTLSDKKTEHHELLKIARKGTTLLEQGAYHTIGELLHESWLIKKSFSKSVSNPQIDELYNIAMNAGATGGKLMGAGGGGCILFHVPMEKRYNVMEALKDLLHIPFKFEPKGSTLIYASA